MRNPAPKGALSIGFLFDDTLDSTDGVANQVKTLGAWLSEQGHKVSYLVGQTELKQWAGGKVYSLAKNQTVNFNGNRLSMPLPASKKKLRAALGEADVDVLHVQVPYSPFLGQYVIGLCPKSAAVVGTFHIYPANALADFGSRLLRILSARSLKRFDFIASVSQPAADFAKKTFKIVTPVIPNMISASTYSSRQTDKISGQIVFLGRLVERKGCRELIEAFSRLCVTNKRARLEIGGDGPQRKKLQALATSLGIADKVNFRGFIKEQDKAFFLGKAEIACFPSLFGESFGIVLIEAMAAGSDVVVAGDNPGYRSILSEKEILLVDPSKTQQFAERLSLMLDDENLRRNLNAWQTKEVQKYDVNVVGGIWLRAYRQAIVKRASKGHNEA